MPLAIPEDESRRQNPEGLPTLVPATVDPKSGWSIAHNHLLAWKDPLRAIPLYFEAFLVWIIITIGIGGFSIWSRFQLGWRAAVVSGAAQSFIVVLLALAMADNVVLAKRNSLDPAEGGRSVAAALALLIAISAMQLPIDPGSRPTLPSLSASLWSVSLLLLALIVSGYLHAFRLRDLSPTAGDEKVARDKRVESLGKAAQHRSQTGDGEAL